MYGCLETENIRCNSVLSPWVPADKYRNSVTSQVTVASFDVLLVPGKRSRETGGKELNWMTEA